MHTIIVATFILKTVKSPHLLTVARHSLKAVVGRRLICKPGASVGATGSPSAIRRLLREDIDVSNYRHTLFRIVVPGCSLR